MYRRATQSSSRPSIPQELRAEANQRLRYVSTAPNVSRSGLIKVTT